MRKLVLMLSLYLSLLGVALVGSTNVLAGELKTIALAVDGMTCSLCPITVKRALRKVEGVSEVNVKYEGNGAGWARVAYDPAVVGIEDLTFATEMAGYPSRLNR